jgi:hypothetical protein
MEVIGLSREETPIQQASSQEQIVEGAKEPPKAPPPSVTGSARVVVLKHDLVEAFYDPLDNANKFPAGVEFAISNEADLTIATAAFEAVFYDNEGNVLETVKHKIIDLPANRSRAILISSSQFEVGKVKSYDVRLKRATTADVEKVQLRKHDIWTTETGEEEIQGIVKNISAVKVGAAVVATFYDANGDSVGTKAAVLRDLEPDAIRRYELRFKPQEGDTVTSFSVAVGELAE